MSKVANDSKLTLRCYVRRGDDRYIAECIDLNIIVVRHSAAEARRVLDEAIAGYLQTVLEDGHRIDGLLPRPSPLSHRAYYHFLALRAALTPGPRRNGYGLFDHPVPRRVAAIA
jgi:hypothetical protein